jgi:hypothetical protein
MSDLKYPLWQTPYLEALTEFDSQRLRNRVCVAETAIGLRMSQLGTGVEGPGERQALTDARNALLSIRRETLKNLDASRTQSGSSLWKTNSYK